MQRAFVHAAREPQDPLEEADRALDACPEALRQLEARIELTLLFCAVAASLLRDGDDVHRLEHTFECFARPVAFVRCHAFRDTSKQGLVALERGTDEGGLDRSL